VQPGFCKAVADLELLLVKIAPFWRAILGRAGKGPIGVASHELGTPPVLQGWWSVFFPAMAIMLALLELTINYRVARRGRESAKCLAGELVATSLWWLTKCCSDIRRRGPYSIV